MRGKPEEKDCAHVLIVEGYSDLLFCVAFLHHIGRLESVFIKEFKGKSNILGDALEVYLNPQKLAEKQSIGIILDADENPEGTAQAVRNRLRNITGRELEEGCWQEGEPRLGFFVAPSPDPHTKGEIETLAWNAFPDDERYRAMKAAVSEYHNKMADLGWISQSPDKGRIGAYLSAAYDEDPRLGPGAREKKFCFDSPGFDRLRAFLEVLPVNS